MSDIPILEIDCDIEFHDDEAIKKSMLDQVNTSHTLQTALNLSLYRCENSSKSCKRQNGPRLKRKLKKWTIRAFRDRRRQHHHVESLSVRFPLPILNKRIRRINRVVPMSSNFVHDPLFTVYHLIRRQINTRLVIVTSFSNCLKYIQN